jgi:hypothetical protein
MKPTNICQCVHRLTDEYTTTYTRHPKHASSEQFVMISRHELGASVTGSCGSVCRPTSCALCKPSITSIRAISEMNYWARLFRQFFWAILGPVRGRRWRSTGQRKYHSPQSPFRSLYATALNANPINARSKSLRPVSII